LKSVGGVLNRNMGIRFCFLLLFVVVGYFFVFVRILLNLIKFL
jgi:hypothetical protein